MINNGQYVFPHSILLCHSQGSIWQRCTPSSPTLSPCLPSSILHPLKIFNQWEKVISLTLKRNGTFGNSPPCGWKKQVGISWYRVWGSLQLGLSETYTCPLQTSSELVDIPNTTHHPLKPKAISCPIADSQFLLKSRREWHEILQPCHSALLALEDKSANCALVYDVLC